MFIDRQDITGWHGEDIAMVARPLGSETLRPSELGCWRGHVDAWKVYYPELNPYVD